MNVVGMKTLLYNALNGIDWGEGITMPLWDTERGEDSERYVIYTNIISTDEESADDEEQDERHLAFVYCYVTREHINELDGFMEKIKTALKSVGFKVSGGHNMATMDDVQSTYIGRYSEFSIWGV